MDNDGDRALERLGEDEEELEAACAALASLFSSSGDGELRRLAGEHQKSAGVLLGIRPRGRVLMASMRAVLTVLVRNEVRALTWLRDREHQLVRSYLALDCRADVDETTRLMIRRVLLPIAFDRFTRVDRLLAEHEHRHDQGAEPANA
jgi:hypothetical protein